jgi:ubiquinone/menaquinone biosynthesis C-methylase UbiE
VVEEFGENLPFEEKNFDLVYGRAILHHADNLNKFCQEMSRVLKTGGIFLATREHIITRKRDLQTFLDSHPLHSLYGGENAFLLGEYLKAFKEAGLMVKEILAPYDSDINLFPSNSKELKEKISHKFKFTVPEWLLKSVAIPLLNKIDQTPGRLFSFVGIKR